MLNSRYVQLNQELQYMEQMSLVELDQYVSTQLEDTNQDQYFYTLIKYLVDIFYHDINSLELFVGLELEAEQKKCLQEYRNMEEWEKAYQALVSQDNCGEENLAENKWKIVNLLQSYLDLNFEEDSSYRIPIGYNKYGQKYIYELLPGGGIKTIRDIPMDFGYNFHFRGIRKKAEEFTYGICRNFLQALSPKGISVTVLNAGKNFSFPQTNSFNDKKFCERASLESDIFSSVRVCNEKQKIDLLLENMEHKCEEFSQLIGSRYRTLMEYNRENPGMELPMELVVVYNNMECGFDSSILCRLMKNYAHLGIYVVFCDVDEDQEAQNESLSEFVERMAAKVQWKDGEFYLTEKGKTEVFCLDKKNCDESIYSLLHQADEANKKQAYQEAAEALKKVSAYGANDSAIYYALYMVYAYLNDPLKRLSYLDKAAKAGNPKALNGEGYMNYDIPGREKTALDSFKRAADQGYAIGQYQYGKKIRSTEPEEGLKYLKWAAEKNYFGAYLELGEFYRQNDQPDLAKEWYFKAVNEDKTRADAYFGLALMYEAKGDVLSAKDAYVKAMEAGHLDAEEQLGYMLYRNGEENVLFYKEAWKYLTDVESKWLLHNAKPEERLGNTLADIAYHLGLYSEKLIYAADKGHAEAQYEYGRLAYECLGDKENAFKYLEMAAKQGHSRAQRCLGQWFK